MFLLLYRGKHGLRHVHLQPFKRSRHSSVNELPGREEKKAAVTLRFSIDFHKFSMGLKKQNKPKTKICFKDINKKGNVC